MDINIKIMVIKMYGTIKNILLKFTKSDLKRALENFFHNAMQESSACFKNLEAHKLFLYF